MNSKTNVSAAGGATDVERLANFVTAASWPQLTCEARMALKVRILDALACALGGFAGPPVKLVRKQVEDFGGNPLATLIGGGRSSPDRAALLNGFAVRYLDFNDAYLAPAETCHPSDNLAAVIAAGEYADADGRQLLVALAVAYQVQCRLSDLAPVRDRGFDHTTQGAYAAAAGVAKALGLDAAKTANAIAIAGTALNALRVTRTGRLSHWKGLAYPYSASAALLATFLAAGGVTGPLEVFEGNKGFMDTISGRFELDWEKEGLDSVLRTITKRYNAEIHSQSALEAVLELREEHRIDPAEIVSIEIDIFDVAHRIIGGGEEGDKHRVETKEQADHSLPYLIAVALIDGQVMPEQFFAERIRSSDVQDLLRRVIVRPDPEFSSSFPERMDSRVTVKLANGTELRIRKSDYQGFHTRPAGWEETRHKLVRLGAPVAEPALLENLASAVEHLEGIKVVELCRLLSQVKSPVSNE